MSEERLERIELKVDRLEAGHAELRAGQDELRRDVGELRAGQQELRQDVSELRAGQQELRQDVSELRAGQNELRVGQEELRAGQMLMDRRLTRVEVVQEEMRDLIKQIAEGHLATQDLVRRESASIRVMIDQRITPLEESVRQLWRRVDPHDHRA